MHPVAERVVQCLRRNTWINAEYWQRTGFIEHGRSSRDLNSQVATDVRRGLADNGLDAVVFFDEDYHKLTVRVFHPTCPLSVRRQQSIAPDMHALYARERIGISINPIHEGT
jgi:hypothetical protein